MSAPVYTWGDSGYHAQDCPCDSHCGNCHDDLAAIRALREVLIEQGASGPHGRYTEADRLHPRARYCSAYCKGRAKRERAFDRHMRARLTAAVASARKSMGEY